MQAVVVGVVLDPDSWEEPAFVAILVSLRMRHSPIEFALRVPVLPEAPEAVAPLRRIDVAAIVAQAVVRVFAPPLDECLRPLGPLVLLRGFFRLLHVRRSSRL